MDSTIMGVLTMVALDGYKKNVVVEAVNMSQTIEELLTTLGVHKVIKFINLEVPAIDWRSGDSILKATMNSSVILDAHKTLMNVSEENIDKFATVVKCLENELNKKGL
jgi:hypothetical protein